MEKIFSPESKIEFLYFLPGTKGGRSFDMKLFSIPRRLTRPPRLRQPSMDVFICMIEL